MGYRVHPRKLALESRRWPEWLGWEGCTGSLNWKHVLNALARNHHKHPCECVYIETNVHTYSGTSLLRSPTGLGKSDLNGEVTVLQGVICTVEYNLGLSQGDCNWKVFLLVR